MSIEEYVALKDDKRQVSDHWMRKKVDAGAIYMKPAVASDAVAVVGVVARTQTFINDGH
jgi:hypothetical protein